MAGDQLANVAFLWLITSLTGSAATLGIVMTALLLPNITFRLVGGIITDRFHNMLVLIGADLLRGAIILVLALLVLSAHVNMGIFLLVALCLGIGGALFTPAYNATVPLLVGQDRLLRFNSALQAGNQGIGILIPALAGMIIAAIGIPAALEIDGISFLISALSILLLVLSRGDQPVHQSSPVRGELKSGLRTAFSHPTVRTLSIAIGVINFADALVVIYPVHLKETLGAGVIWYGLINASVMAGLFAINLLYIWKGKHIRLGFAFFIGALVEGFGVLAFGLSHSLFIAMLAFFLFGAGMAGFGTAATTSIQQGIDQAYLGRAFSLYGLFALSLMPLGYFASSLLSRVLSTGTIIALAGIVMFLTAFWLLVQSMSLWQSRMKGSSA
jgi:MFS family permease